VVTIGEDRDIPVLPRNNQPVPAPPPQPVLETVRPFPPLESAINVVRYTCHELAKWSNQLILGDAFRIRVMSRSAPAIRNHTDRVDALKEVCVDFHFHILYLHHHFSRFGDTLGKGLALS